MRTSHIALVDTVTYSALVGWHDTCCHLSANLYLIDTIHNCTIIYLCNSRSTSLATIGTVHGKIFHKALLTDNSKYGCCCPLKGHLMTRTVKGTVVSRCGFSICGILFQILRLKCDILSKRYIQYAVACRNRGYRLDKVVGIFYYHIGLAIYLSCFFNTRIHSNRYSDITFGHCEYACITISYQRDIASVFINNRHCPVSWHSADSYRGTRNRTVRILFFHKCIHRNTTFLDRINLRMRRISETNNIFPRFIIITGAPFIKLCPLDKVRMSFDILIQLCRNIPCSNFLLVHCWIFICHRSDVVAFFRIIVYIII